jgi:glycosyltransferase involved in cell wall biosynthesis
MLTPPDIMDSKFRVSVLLNVWAGDNPVTLSRSIASIYQQSLEPDELVVVVDGPIPDVLNAALRAAVRGARVPTNIEVIPTNHGLWNARNVGLSLCSQNTVALHDSDDVMHPNRILIQQREFQATNVSVLGCPVFEFDTTCYDIVGARVTPVGKPLKESDFWLRNPIHHSSVMLSKRDVQAVGNYRNLPGVEDLDLWRRLARSGASLANDTRVVQALGTSQDLLRRRRISRSMLVNELRLARDSIQRTSTSDRLRTIIALGIRCTYRVAPTNAMKLGQQRFLRRPYKGPPHNLDEFLTQSPFDISQEHHN